MSDEKRAKIRSITPLVEGAEIPLSDFQVAFSTDEGVMMVNLDLLDDNDKKQEYKIQPGFWRITPKDGLMPLELKERSYFETSTYETLSKHFSSFLNKFELYKTLGIPAKRGILLGSIPGTGKTSTVEHFINKQVKQRENACLLRIDSDKISWEMIIQMFMNSSENDVSFIVLVIEDIGGTGLEEFHSRSVSPELLNFLDGTSDIFKIPTLIIGTTNYLDNLDQVLTNRPGRFDFVMQVEPPAAEECFFLMEEFIKKIDPTRKLTEEEKKAIIPTNKTRLTPAYCREVIVRSYLNDISIQEAAKQVHEQKRHSEKQDHYHKKSNVGFGD